MARLLNSPKIDTEGVSTLAAIQRMMTRSMVIDGEALLVFPAREGARSSFRVRVLEADFRG